jgi:ribosomal-protein-alanine N-acetyltransferase
MQSPLTLTPFCAADAPDVAALAHLTLPEAWSEAAFAALADNPLARCLLARRDGVLLGFAFLYLVGDEGQIMEVATHPDARRQGVARTLLCRLLADATDGGATRFTLEVRAQNEAARTLYASLGFVEDGVRRRYYRNPTDDAVLMSRTV